MIHNEDDFVSILERYVDSSSKLASAAALCDGDPIKQQMLEPIHDDFEAVLSKSEGIKLMVEKNFFDTSKDFIIQEIKIMTQKNYDMAQKIENILEGL